MPPKILTLGDAFADFEREQREQLAREETPGTPEHARAQAFAAAHKQRVADKVAGAVAAGGVIGVTHTDQGEPIDLSPAEPDDDDEEEDDDESEP